MTLTDPTIILFLVGTSLAAGGLSAGIGMMLTRRRGGFSHAMLRGLDLPHSYVFRDGYLLSDVDGTDAMLTDPTDRVGAWAELRESLSALNPEVATKMEALRTRGNAFVLIGRVGRDELSISGRMSKGRCLISIASLEPGRDRRMIDQAGLDALEAELDLLRHGLDAGDTLLWQEDAEGQIIWANQAYFERLRLIQGGDDALVWPIPKLVDLSDPLLPGQPRRIALEAEDEADMFWLEVTARDYRSGQLLSAVPVDRLVSAEHALRDFVQTLSRTFAHLPTGLAIFDKDRRLALFNPALVELSTLSSAWLSARPDLFAFLDGLREKQRMPEPKDYQAWRAGLGELEQAARDGTYQDNWSLPNGQTLRVIGRPHADGAVAFLFEDISQEVTLTRKFRGDLDLYRSILDDNAEAMAVFARDGRFVLSNAAYRSLWPEEADTLSDASKFWRAACMPTPLWEEIQDYVRGSVARPAWSESVVLKDGSKLVCRLAPLKGGARLVAFSKENATPSLDLAETVGSESASEIKSEAALISSG